MSIESGEMKREATRIRRDEVKKTPCDTIIAYITRFLLLINDKKRILQNGFIKHLSDCRQAGFE